MTNSKYICPVCELPLSLEDTLSGGIAAFCAWGKCPSYVANNGAEAKTEDDAFRRLQGLIEQEITQNDNIP